MNHPVCIERSNSCSSLLAHEHQIKVVETKYNCKFELEKCVYSLYSILTFKMAQMCVRKMYCDMTRVLHLQIAYTKHASKYSS